MEMVLRMDDVVDMDDEHFYALCQNNPDMRLERNADGDVVIMPPTGGDTSRRNAEIIVQLGIWARRDGPGFYLILPAASACPTAPSARPTRLGWRRGAWQA